MLICISACHKDIDAAYDWADWLREIEPGGYANHSAVVVGSVTLDPSQIYQLAAKFTAAGFKVAIPIRAKTEETPSWPNAANAMWRLAAQYLKDNYRTPFLWCEVDAIPLREGWLNLIEAEYLASKKGFMGTVYPHPYNHLNGIAVYPANIHKFNPLYFNSEFYGMPFDCVRPDLTLKEAHITKLIHRSLEDHESNAAHSFPDLESLSIIPHDCVLFHGCKDGSLISRLREAKHPAPAIQSKPSLGEKIINGVKRLVSNSGPYLHAGNLGDVIYSLPAIKAAGGGDLIICPQQRKTAICAVPIDQKQFAMVKPLLEAQSYLKSVTYSESYPSHALRDLNHFRSTWINRSLCKKHGIDTLAKAHFHELGILNRFDEQAPWLTCGDPIKTGKLICHRSPRYNAPTTGPEAFPWQRIVDEHHAEMLFVGLESEHDSFYRTFGKKISFWRVSDFMELARVIKGGKCFVGNQSMPLSVAIGLGQHVICESLPRSPDTRFYRNNYRDQLICKDYSDLISLLK